ncbi:hypothetical protein [Flavobacterium selenitireducens]|uniref:hypothetical protein n=1 Tax=Flavobacterium selenitireducens TaxID=2722704 RepID=UPI00168B7EAF|nr:hypothetical protein [Flavobacterium selenitireducens]MBD3581566.1 hypothetical protein [Flavobacterium selenitireducens]
MKQFYSIAEEGKVAHEFDIPFFGDVISHNVVQNHGAGILDFAKVERPASDAEYDMKFRSTMYLIKPIYKVPLFLEYHLSKYAGDKSGFLYQIRYVILPKTKLGKKAHAEIIERWLDMKEGKENIGTYSIKTGDVNAPIQIQQNSNHSKQRQTISFKSEDIKNLFEILKKDLEKLDANLREDFDLEMRYAIKQLEKANDISPQLLNIGTMIKNVGLPIFTSLTSSGIFELAKPLLGIS